MENVIKKKLGRPTVIVGGSSVLAVRLPMEHHQFVVSAAKRKRLPITEILRPDGHPNSPTYGHLKFPHPGYRMTSI